MLSVIFWLKRYRQLQSTQSDIKLIVHDISAYALPHKIEAVCTEERQAIGIIKAAAVCNIGIDGFQQKLFPGIELSIQFFLYTIEDVLLFSEIIEDFISQIHFRDFKEIEQFCLLQFLRCLCQDALMQPLKIIIIVRHTLLCLEVNIVRPVIRQKSEGLVDCLIPKNLARTIALDDVFRVAIHTVLIIVLHKEQKHSKQIKCAALTAVIEHPNNLFLSVVFLQNF